MRGVNVSRYKRLLLGVMPALLLAAPVANADPALDRVLNNVLVSNQKQCTAIDIGFNLRVRYLSHFPSGNGQELRIQVRPIDTAFASSEIVTRRESLRPPATKYGRIRAITFEAGSAAGPILTIQFDQPTRFDVSQGGEFQSIVVKILDKGDAANCNAEFPRQSSIGEWSTTVTADTDFAAPGGGAKAHASGRGKGNASADQQRQAAGLLDEGRAAMRKERNGDAIAKFKQILSLPENESSASAQEYLALAYQRNKDTGQAKAEYEDYLARYPAGEGSERVRQRLSGLLTATGEMTPELKAATGGSGKSRGDVPQTWTVSGSVSQYYIRDDSFRTLRDPSLPPEINNTDLDAHDVHQNELLTGLDAIATWSGPGFKSKLRFSGTEEHKFNNDDEIVGVSALYVEAALKDLGAETRIGRQTRSSGGVLGRFDGGVFSYSPAELFRLNAVVGSPVNRRRDTPFEDDKLFYGASADFGPFNGLDFTLFGIEQRDRSILDRRAVGGEMRYFDDNKSAFALVDYDIHYNELNAAVVNGAWTLADKTNLHASYEYRKSPYLSTWTALQGQPYPTLYEMLKFNTLTQVEQLAVDRTASYTSVSAGFAKPLNETFQVSFDVTMTNFSSTNFSPATAGSVEIPASPGSGNEFYYQGQLIGNNVITEGDLFIAGMRFADLRDSNLYVADFSARYPLMDDLKINPRLLLQYRTGKTTDLEEYTILPSVLFNYYVTRDWSLELEVGATFTRQTQTGATEDTNNLFFTIGYRYDFYADGLLASQARAAPYGAGGPK